MSVVPFAVHAFERTVDGQDLEFTLDGNNLIDSKTGSEWNLDGVSISGPLKETTQPGCV